MIFSENRFTLFVLVTPEKEFDLGVVGADQRIVREMDGNRVVGATVVNRSEVED